MRYSSLLTLTTASTPGQGVADGGHAMLDFNLFLFLYFSLKAPLIEGMLRLKKKGHGMFEDPWKARAMCQVVC